MSSIGIRSLVSAVMWHCYTKPSQLVINHRTLKLVKSGRTDLMFYILQLKLVFETKFCISAFMSKEVLTKREKAMEICPCHQTAAHWKMLSAAFKTAQTKLQSHLHRYKNIDITSPRFQFEVSRICLLSTVTISLPLLLFSISCFFYRAHQSPNSAGETLQASRPLPCKNIEFFCLINITD